MKPSKVGTYALFSCVLITAVVIYAYTAIDIFSFKEDRAKFLLQLRVGQLGESLLILILLYLVYRRPKLNQRGLGAVLILGVMAFVNLYNAVFELTRSGILPLLLPTILVITVICLYRNERNSRNT